MKIYNIEKKIIKKFNIFKNWEDKYEYLINYNLLYPKLILKKKKKKYLLKKCQSKIWIKIKIKNQKMKILINANSIIIKNLILILINIYNNQKLKNILKSKLTFIKKIKFDKYISLLRQNSLLEIIKYIKKISLINLKNPL
ncbi:MAG: SufE family protein [Candidatus Shikimatogenerans sp. Tcar]|uniref:SufE family protein n=1 Tax=Candidatus Shikimatogenerans sp. Tcar TaxID=3158565 RepID=A0AAU7QRV5_9FLAO